MSDLRECFCEFISNLWLGMRGLHTSYERASSSNSMEAVLDSMTSRQIQIEVQDRRCVCEARRLHASGSKALFRAKMLEHRRLQAQLLQLQRYRESVLAQMDAVSNHELNRTFMKALRGAIGVKEEVTAAREDVETTVNEFQDTMHQVKEISDFLGNPTAFSDVISDEDLEREFMDEMDALKPLPSSETVTAPPVAPRRLVLDDIHPAKQDSEHGYHAVRPLMVGALG